MYLVNRESCAAFSVQGSNLPENHKINKTNNKTTKLNRSINETNNKKITTC